MKKDENPKVNIAKDRGNGKYEPKISGQKNQLTKPFLGCNTCKLKNPVKKPNAVNENYGKFKKYENIQTIQNMKIKLTDLCDEDKKRIVELMEELSKFAENNKNLKEQLDRAEKAKQEQNDCLVKQTNIHLEEKNIFLKEIQTYKAKLDACELEMKEKLTKWESKEKFMDKEILYLAKSLQKSFNEKNDLLKEIDHLKACLKQSLESFELLRNEVTALQHLSLSASKTSQSPRCPTINEDKWELVRRPEDSKDEILSTMKDVPPEKTGLDVINMKLEKLYILLQKRSVTDAKSMDKISVADELKSPGEVDLKNVEKEKVASDTPTETGESKKQNELKHNAIQGDINDAKTIDSNYKFLKPIREYIRTSNQAERILKKIEKPFYFDNHETLGRDKMEDEDSGRRIQYKKHLINYDEFAKNSDHEPKDECFDEDRLLNDLFYSNNSIDVGLESVLLLASIDRFRHHNIYSNI